MPADDIGFLAPGREHVEEVVHLAELAPDRQQRATHAQGEVAAVVLEIARNTWRRKASGAAEIITSGRSGAWKKNQCQYAAARWRSVRANTVCVGTMSSTHRRVTASG